MLRQIEWGEQMDLSQVVPEVLPGTTLLFWKFYLSLRTTNQMSTFILSVSDRVQCIWGCFFPVNIF